MFLTAPALYPAKDGWTLRDPLVFVYRGKKLTVPAESFTDLSSIPKWLPILVVLFNPIAGKDRYPAVLHDYLYRTKWGTRAECDKVYLVAMKSTGVSWLKRHALYAGVRAGGWTRGNW